jgi:arylsulfatase A-like enzyme
MMTRTRASYILGLLLGAFLIGPQSGLCKPADKQPPYNIILVTPDQLRADFMHTYGYPLPNTPQIDHLAREGTVFLHAYSDGAWTTPSFTSMLTGLFPTVHGMTLPPPQFCGPYIARPMAAGEIPPVPEYLALSRHKQILPEILKAHGMTTAANCWAAWNIRERGWDSFKFFPGSQLPNPEHPKVRDTSYLTAPQTLEWAQQWLRAHREQRFFFWVHFMEPHSPYNVPRNYDQFRTDEDFPDLFEDNLEDSTTLHGLAKTGDIHAIRRLHQLYAAKILYVDHYIGELVKTVHDLGLDNNTIIILVSDHGQLAFSHPSDFNTDDHRSVYDANLHVPLIFRGPGVPAGQRVNAIVGLYDLVPTILDLENLPRIEGLNGNSLKPILMRNSTQVHKYTYSEISIDMMPQYSVRDQRYKLIETLSDGRIQCFDTLADPGETHDICNEVPAKAAELKGVLDKHIQTMIQQAKSYPDWQDNLALAVIEGRVSRGLLALAPKSWTVSRGAEFQLSGRLWSLVKGAQTFEGSPAYWAPPGPGTASVEWRLENPAVGEYEISIWYGSVGDGQHLATNASYLVRFRGGTLAFPIDQNRNQGRWNVLGRFHEPISVELTNRADGAVVTGAVRFQRVSAE